MPDGLALGNSIPSRGGRVIIPAVTKFLETPRVFVILVAMGLFAMAFRGVTDPDVWWHLRTGELIAQTHQVPQTDPYSFTGFGKAWVSHEWLSDLLMYWLYRAGGWGGLITVFAGMTAAALMLAYARSAGRPYVAAAVTVWGAAAAAPTWGVRPQTISLLLASTFLFLLERSTIRRSLLWWTIPLTMLWVNLHAGYALGIALMMLFAAGTMLDVVFGREAWPDAAPRLRVLSLATLACIAVVPFNPHGTQMYWYPLQTLGSAGMQNYISEWFSPNFHENKFLPFLFLVLGMIAVLSAKTRMRPRDMLLLLVTLAGALHSLRHIPIFVLVAIPVLSAAVQWWWQSWSHHTGSLESAGRTKLALNAVVVAAFVVFIMVRVRTVTNHQGELEAEHFPAAAVDFIAAHRPPGPLLSHYNWGGYLIWRLYPQYRVFIDGRADVYGDAFMNQFRELVYLTGKGTDELDRWKIRTVMLPVNTPLPTVLRLSHDWTEIYQDSRAVIFSRKQAPGFP